MDDMSRLIYPKYARSIISGTAGAHCILLILISGRKWQMGHSSWSLGGKVLRGCKK
ncbi:hypothetical protein NA56DRAFT_304818 [Hyaloscypha hepaticicola]|uniref:Uncharacterized protein n=1 Tax=Hyaloscypha hepaticicola TaxID=2082293 RepID=A0A2J6PSB9_9HELO|nr:hypothetical protein NA56DRAFT_304818 [Hyaloscypha hepaticicola]